MRLDDLGPALKRLRVAKGLTQEAVAVTFGRQVQTVSRLEQPGANPQAVTVVRYLNALGASFGDLDRALNDPTGRSTLSGVGARGDERFRRTESDPEIGDVLDLIKGLDSRLKLLEESRVKSLPNGGESG